MINKVLASYSIGDETGSKNLIIYNTKDSENINIEYWEEGSFGNTKNIRKVDKNKFKKYVQEGESLHKLYSDKICGEGITKDGLDFINLLY